MSDAPVYSADEVRWYTSARKVPKYIGKPPGGGTYPGGPYTVTQFVGGALIFTAGAYTEEWWGPSNWLVNKVILVAVTAAFMAVAKMFKPGGRSLLIAVPAYVGAVVGTPLGQFRGKRVKPPRTSVVRHNRVHVCLDGVISAPDPTAPDHTTFAITAAADSALPQPIPAVHPQPDPAGASSSREDS